MCNLDNESSTEEMCGSSVSSVLRTPNVSNAAILIKMKRSAQHSPTARNEANPSSY